MNSNHHNRRVVVGANGAPTQINFQPVAFAGPWQTPVVFPPLQPQADGTMRMAVFGGATRLETIASRLLAGMLKTYGGGDLMQLVKDPAERKFAAEAATALAFDLLMAADSFQPPEAADVPSTEAPPA